MRYLAAVAVAMLTFSSCVNDLETLPLNEWDVTSETAYGADETSYVQGLAKLYNTISTHELTDISGVDGGATSTIRAFWACQEVTTDACKIAWGNDAWTRAMNTNTWSDAENEAVYGVFFRSLQAIAYVNEYLRQTAPGKLSERGVSAEVSAKIDGFRAEARFIRAYYYWMAMDVFGAVPFSTEDSAVGSEAPAQQPAEFIYNFVVSELEALAADDSAMPEAQSNYPRADKGSVLGLLARVYLNAEVYKGEAEWLKCQQTCERIFQLGYALCPEYYALFRGDNGQNDKARGEFLFAVDYDSHKTESYGGTAFLTLAAIATTDVTDLCKPNGVNGGWGGIRCTQQFAERYFYVNTDPETMNTRMLGYLDPEEENQKTIIWVGDDEADGLGDADLDKQPSDTLELAHVSAYKLLKNDDRAKLFYLRDRLGEITNAEQLYLFQYGWSCLKFNNIPHNMTEEEFRKQAAEEAYADIDFPVVRLGEIYLIYAEACLNLGEGSKAQSYIDQLQTRANVEASEKHTLGASWTDAERDWFVAERARELYWEAHRRTDLIRWNLFTSDKFLWPFKGGETFQGAGFPDFKKLFAIPASQITANPALQNPAGY